MPGEVGMIQTKWCSRSTSRFRYPPTWTLSRKRIVCWNCSSRVWGRTRGWRFWWGKSFAHRWFAQRITTIRLIVKARDKSIRDTVKAYQTCENNSRCGQILDVTIISEVVDCFMPLDVNKSGGISDEDSPRPTPTISTEYKPFSQYQQSCLPRPREWVVRIL